MSLSTQVFQFLGVASAYIVFTFAWGWYKGGQEDEESAPDRGADRAGGER